IPVPSPHHIHPPSLHDALPISGRRYLEERRNAMEGLAAAAEQAHGRIQHLASAWRIRAGNRPDMLRCYALLPRVAEKDFRHQIQIGRASCRERVESAAVV